MAAAARLIIRTSLLIFTLGISACGGIAATNTPSRPETAPALPGLPATATPIPPTPTHAPTATTAPLPRVGQQASTQAVVVTLDAARDPALPVAATPMPGNRFVAFLITLTSTESQPIVFSLDAFGLRDTEAHLYRPMPVSVVPPALYSGVLTPKERRQGWITIQVPTGVELATLTYDPPESRTRVIFSVSKAGS